MFATELIERKDDVRDFHLFAIDTLGNTVVMSSLHIPFVVAFPGVAKNEEIHNVFVGRIFEFKPFLLMG